MSSEINMTIRAVCVYCGSSPGGDPAFVEQATRLGELLADRDLALVYGGGDRGLMGAVARGVLSRGGAVTGIIPEFLKAKEQSSGETDLDGATMIIVPDMHTRKGAMFERADAFVALPGGIGTLEELIEMLTWAQLRRHTKPVFLLNTNGFWDPLNDLLKRMEAEGFLHNASAAKPIICDAPDEIVERLAATQDA
ncbi:MAG: TIGR00730 family Rossman fold protein [Ahrensia sp.]|nr:TIGR00730 family Rossman fold protein [Ahrensia sp.]